MSADSRSEQAAMSRPSYGAVVLTMGTRPIDFPRALESLLAQEGVDLDVVVVGNGWTPVGLPESVRIVALAENVGIPEGRNIGARHATGEFLFFFDDDAYLPQVDVLRRLAEVFAREPRVGFVQPRAVDPQGKPPPRRWVPRLRTGDPLRGGVVAMVWEGVFAIRRTVFDGAGGWPGHFFYGHEGIELAWRTWDQGCTGYYAADVVVNHPATSPTRHAEFWRNNARNRVWVARRNLPLPLIPIYLAVWVVLTIIRVRRARDLIAWFSGFRDGLTGGHGERRPIRWRTVLRMSVAGRPPIV